MESIANSISIIRIFFALILILVKPLSLQFFLIYIICGISDIFDGYIARKTNTVSKLGAKLDSVADIIMIIVMIIVLYTIMNLTVETIIWIIGIGIIRVFSMLVIFLKYKTFGIPHTYGNKITGFLLFAFPFCITFIDLDVLVYITCIIASISAIEELTINIFSNKLELDKKSIIIK